MTLALLYPFLAGWAFDAVLSAERRCRAWSLLFEKLGKRRKLKKDLDCIGRTDYGWGKRKDERLSSEI